MKKFALLLLLLPALAHARQAASPVKLAGTGVTSHSVTLNWVQSTSAGVTANKVYRSSISGGNYVLLFTSTSPIITYQDTSVSANQTWFYVTTAVCPTCSPVESVNSNETRQVVAADAQPQPPTGLTSSSQ